MYIFFVQECKDSVNRIIGLVLNDHIDLKFGCDLVRNFDNT